mgnify:CR=1 FL=1
MRRLSFALFTFGLILPLSAEAHLTSDFDVGVGFSSMQVRVGDSFSKTLDALSTLEINYNLLVNEINSSLTLSFMEIADSDLGVLPYTRLGLGLRWYLFGLNGRRVILDNQAVSKVWKASPFLGLSVGLANIALNDGDQYFNASVMDYMVRAGVEVPIAFDWMLTGQFVYVLGMKTDSGNGQAISYGGVILLTGLKMSTF